MSRNYDQRKWLPHNNIYQLPYNELYGVRGNFYNYQFNNYYNSYPIQSFENMCSGNINTNVQVQIPQPPSTSKVVKKHHLYKNFERQAYENETKRTPKYELNQSNNSMGFWQKETGKNENLNDTDTVAFWNTPKKVVKTSKKNGLEETLNRMATPVEISKGRSLLEKMGWKGGGLGKDGAGIVEPIVPKAKYATKTLGLGHGSEPVMTRYSPEPVQREIDDVSDEDLEFNNNFRTNILRKIQDFVKNDSEIELIFDCALCKSERKKIHAIVLDLREGKDVKDVGYDKQLDLQIYQDILLYNRYLLFTESDGRPNKRKLRVFKEVPPNVYLILPDDLIDYGNDDDYEENDEITQTIQENKDGQVTEIIEIKDDDSKSDNEVTNENSNSEISEKSNSGRGSEITNKVSIDSNKASDVKKPEMKLNQKFDSSKNPPKSVLMKIVNYFKDFVKDSKYFEFRFLGPFKGEEIAAIKTFFDICLKRNVGDSREKNELQEVLKMKFLKFQIREDYNGTLVFFKKNGRRISPRRKNGGRIIYPMKAKEKRAAKALSNGVVTSNDFKFRTRILLMILEFVKDNTQTDLHFGALRNFDRKKVHCIVQKLRESERAEDLSFDSVDTDIARSIMRHNNCLLVTESYGKDPDRKLRLYKDVFPYVKLIKPDDFKDRRNKKACHQWYDFELHEDEIENVTESLTEDNTSIDNETSNKQSNNEDSNCENVRESNEDANEFQDKSPDRKFNEVNTKTKQPSALCKIVGLFKKFVKDTSYCELRFLGRFGDKEAEAIKIFFDVCLKKNVEEVAERSELVQALISEHYDFNITEDNNGGYILNKVEKTHQPQSSDIFDVKNN